MNICTIIAKNYIAHARVLAKSFREHHPNGTCTVLLIDDPEGTIDAGAEPFEILRVEGIGMTEWYKAVARHDIAELSTTVKPWLLKYLLERGASHVACFDPDIQIFAPLDDIGELAEKHGIVLTPHTTEPIPRDGEKPTEYEVLSAGVYNLGFIAVGAGETSTRFLDWWSEGSLKDYSVEKPREVLIDQQWTPIWQSQPLFADQRWVDVVPSLFPTTKILQDPGCNVAYWNLHARTLERDGAVIMVNGQRLRFFHFSGFRPELPYWLSKYATRAKVSENDVLGELCESYATLLEEHGYKEAICMPYGYRQLPDEIPYDDRLRRLYMGAVAAGEDFGNIFELEGARAFLGRLNAPSDWGGHHGVTRFMYYGVYAERLDVQREFKDLSGPDGANFVRWFVREGQYQYDDLPDQLVPVDPESPQGASEPRVVRVDHVDKQLPFKPDSPQGASESSLRYPRFPQNQATVKPDSPQGASESRVVAEIDGVNVVGYLGTGIGLGEAARAYVSALKAAGIPVTTQATRVGIPIAASLFNAGDKEAQKAPDKNRSADGTVKVPNPYSTNLVCINAEQLPQFYKEAGEDFFKNRYTIGVWGWETNSFPEEWLPSFKYLNELWVYTTYVAEILSQVSPVPVIAIPLPVTAPDPSNATVDLGIPEGFTFLFLFDFYSVSQRKNPLGLIEAFKRAFAPGEGPQLVIKSIHGSQLPEFLEHLRYAARNRPDIHIVDRYVSLREKNALMAGCDCYVSLHRAEGFGLTLAEAMALGKPAIATGYSGNLDFMNNANSYLVNYTMTEIPEGIAVYSKAGGTWAEPNLDHAAQLMRQVWENQDEARARGERARRDIESTLSPEAVGKIARARLERSAELSATPASPASHHSPIQSASTRELPSDQATPASLASHHSTTASVPDRSGKAEHGSAQGSGRQLRLARRTLKQGPDVGGSSRLGHAGRFIRRLVLRVIAPFTSYQHQLDSALISTLQEMTQRQKQLERESSTSNEALERISTELSEVTEELPRISTELSEVTSGLQIRLDPSHSFVSYVDERGTRVMGFHDSKDDTDETDIYLSFENVFRGDERTIKDHQAWYMDIIADRPWVLDVGCGRGEFLDLLSEQGIKGRGVDIDEGMVSHCRAKGHDVVLSDANVYLREQDDESIPAIFAAHVVEHLPYEDLLEFLRLAEAKLETGGLLIFETVNYHSIVGMKNFWLDLSHQHPIFPEVALTLCRLAGFRSGRVVFPNSSDDFEKELFSTPEYGVIATKTAQGHELSALGPAKETFYLGHPFVYPSDSKIGAAIGNGAQWDAVLRPILATLLAGEEPTICEVGSNIGASLLQMLASKPRARILAFEPSTRFLPFLERNLKLAGADNVEVFPFFLGKEAGSAWLYNNAITASAASVNYDGHEPRGKQLTEITTLDDVLRKRGRVDFLKIDTDGYDFEVLRGAESTLRHDQPILYFEVATYLLSDPTAKLAWLQSLGYRRFACIIPADAGKLIGITEDPEQVLAWSNTTGHGYCDVLVCHEHSSAQVRLENLELD